MRQSATHRPNWLKPLIFVLLLAPMAVLGIAWIRLLTGASVPALTADPVAQTTRELGEWSLRTLLVALSVSPVARLSGWTQLLAARRMIGLIAFSYVLAHWTFWMSLDLGWSVNALVKEVTKRRYILFGMAGFLCLLPLAVTSTKKWVKRLGGRRWQRLHRLVYLAGAAGCVHYAMLVKGNQTAPKVYLAILAALLVARYLPPKRVRPKVKALNKSPVNSVRTSAEN